MPLGGGARRRRPLAPCGRRGRRHLRGGRTVADGNTVPALLVHTEARLAEVTDAASDPVEAPYFRWWPDESGVETDSDELAALAAELGEWAEAHPDFSADPEVEFAWSDRWIAATDRTLIR